MRSFKEMSFSQNRASLLEKKALNSALWYSYKDYSH